MTRPRQVLPGRFYLVTRRCAQRQYLLRPDEITNESFVYCFAEAAQRFEIDVVLVTAMSNHYHAVVWDRHGRVPVFMEHVHKMFARCQNARWGRWENLWSSEEPCVTELLTPDTVIDKLVYAASNPVKDLLVERATQWPGVNGYALLLGSRRMRAKRPRHFFREGGVMPAEVELELIIPPELGSADAIIAAVRDGVERIEHEMREERAKTGKRILGRRAVLDQSWRSSPASTEPRRNLRPRFAGPKQVMVDAIAGFHAFLSAYQDARERWITGVKHVTFPRGTYWLAAFAPIITATAET
jgi:putative transposase